MLNGKLAPHYSPHQMEMRLMREREKQETQRFPVGYRRPVYVSVNRLKNGNGRVVTASYSKPNKTATKTFWTKSKAYSSPHQNTQSTGSNRIPSSHSNHTSSSQSLTKRSKLGFVKAIFRDGSKKLGRSLSKTHTNFTDDNLQLDTSLDIANTNQIQTMDMEVDDNGRAVEIFPLDKPICAFSEYDPFTIGDATQGVQIFGAIGSGKTSGSGAFLAKSYLTANFGGLILTVKTDEKETWQRYCEETGRDLVVFNLESDWRFNFLEYEMKRKGGGGKTENVVDLFFSILELDVNDRNDKGERYWDKALKQLLRNTIDLAKLSGEEVDLYTLYQIIITAPQSLEELKPQKNLKLEKVHNSDFNLNSNLKSKPNLTKPKQSKWWKSDCGQKLTKAQIRKKKGELTKIEESDLDMVMQYFLKEFPTIADKTRSIIVSSFTGMADMFLRGDLRELFCTTTNFVPEFIHEGMVVILDLPVKKYRKLGQYAQSVIKYCFQQATEARDVEPDVVVQSQATGGFHEQAQTQQTHKPNPHLGLRPVFIWADEAQYFINSHDMLFQTTARSSKACTVYLTQNLPNYETGIGKMTYSLLGNLQTKIFHQNTDKITNNYASDIIGRVYQEKSSTSQNYNSATGEAEASNNFGSSSTLELQYDLEPVEFTRLAKGGAEYGYVVEGIVYCGGRIFYANDRSFLKVEFGQ